MNELTAEDIQLLAPEFSQPVTVCVLLYGDHLGLCERFFEGLVQNTPPGTIQLRVGLNAVSERTRKHVQEAAEAFPGSWVIDSRENIYKLPMMRRLFTDQPLETEWVLWFDDDSYVSRPDWLLSLALAVQSRPEVGMWGSPRLMMPDPPLMKYMEEASWHRGKPFQRHPETSEPVVSFIVGGYWAIRRSVLELLDWPDRRLVHFEDDYILGEALRQNEIEIGRCESSVVIDAARRRCPADAPWVR